MGRAPAVESLLAAAGFTDVAFTDVREPVYYGADAAAALELVRDMKATRDLLAQLDAAAAHRALTRLRATLDLEMNPGLPAGVRHPGLGDVDPARFTRGIALVAAGSSLPRTPAADDVFTRAHLPPAAERHRPPA